MSKYPRYYSTKKQLVETEVEIDGSTGVHRVRLVRYYLEHETERTDWRGKFGTYKEAHEFGFWWKKHQGGAIFSKEIK